MGDAALSRPAFYLLLALAADTRNGASIARDAERRRYYRLTARGREIAQAEAERLDALVRAAREWRLLPAGSRG